MSVCTEAGGWSWYARVRTSVLMVTLSKGGRKAQLSQVRLPPGDLPRSQYAALPAHQSCVCAQPS